MKRRTLGPVADLEQHLPDEWWKTIFNATYLRTDGDVVENPENTSRDVDLLVRVTDLAADARVLDLCCGQGRHCLELARRGHHRVTGVDRSRYLIGLARKRARAAGLGVAFHEGDARRFKAAEAPFDVVSLLGNSFGYFHRADDDRAVLRAVRSALRPGGSVALEVSDGAWIRANFAPRSWEWIGPEELVCRERSLSADGDRLVCREVVVHAARGVIADQFYAQRLYDRASLLALLEGEGFDDACDHAALAAASERNQDLGMMEQTFFVTARSQESSGARPRRDPPLDVVVLLGDPRQADPIRPDGAFTVDDRAELTRLRAALGELAGYAFRFHDDHASLLDSLRARPPALVFNLCDEGFGNDLRAELHVPALLEVLGIPYSGAGPACLGLCIDKSHVRAIAASLGVPVPREVCLAPGASADQVDVGLPAIVKPRLGDGSVGIDQNAVVRTPEALRARVAALRAQLPGVDVLAQEFLVGEEYSVGLVGNPGLDLEALPVLEVNYDALPPELPQILGYESKWNHPPTPYWTHVGYRQCRLAVWQRDALVATSKTLFEQLGCRDYARFDFRTGDDGVIRLLEVNPNPGWGWGDELNYMATWAGMSYPQLLQRILDAAHRRTNRPRPASALATTSHR